MAAMKRWNVALSRILWNEESFVGTQQELSEHTVFGSMAMQVDRKNFRQRYW